MKYQEFKKCLNKPYFSAQDILIHKGRIYNYQLSLWKQKGYIQHLKRGLYYFTDAKQQFSAKEVSFLLYEPSYISMESALSFYGIIPEMVRAITAVTSKTTRRFTNDYGSFIYRHIDPKLFFGYTPTNTPHGKYLMAQPEKALLDYLYFNLGHLNNQADIDEIRINYEELSMQLNKKTMEQYALLFDIKKLHHLTQLILKQC